MPGSAGISCRTSAAAALRRTPASQRQGWLRGQGTAPSAPDRTRSRHRPCPPSRHRTRCSTTRCRRRARGSGAVDLGGDVIGDGPCGALGERAGSGNGSVGAIAQGVHVWEGRCEVAGITAIQPSVPPRVSPEAATTAGTRCTGTPMNKSYGISPVFSWARCVCGFSPRTSRPGV